MEFIISKLIVSVCFGVLADLKIILVCCDVLVSPSGLTIVISCDVLTSRQQCLCVVMILSLPQVE